jgi:hypothetical protein
MKKVSSLQAKQDAPFTKGDFLTEILKGHLKLPNWLITISITLVLNIPILIASAINNALFSTTYRIGLLNDYSWCLHQFTSIPATIFYFFWLPDEISKVIKGLRQNKVLSIPKNEEDKFHKFLTQFDRAYSHRVWALGSFILVAAFMVLMAIPEHKTFITWETSGSFIFWYTTFFWAFFFFIGLLGVVRVIVITFWFNRLFKEFKIDVRVLHPDGAGGLSPLGEFSVKIGYLIGVYGLASVSVTLSESYVTTTKFSGPMLTNALIPLLIVYLILAPVVFFTPIGAARFAMKEAKRAFILQIADQFDLETTKLQTLFKSDSNELGSGLEKIEELQKIHAIATKFPVWPFNVENLLRFFSAISSPFVLGVVSLIFNFIH